MIFQTFSGPFWGMLADRFNRKWILVIGTGIWGLWTSICGLATNYWQLLTVRVIACIGLGCLYPASFSILADSFGPKKAGERWGRSAPWVCLALWEGTGFWGGDQYLRCRLAYGFIGLGLMSLLTAS